MKDTTKKLIQKSTAFYHRYEKYYAIASFVAGFLWDSFTLTRIDRLSDNLILLAYLVLIGALIPLSHLARQNDPAVPEVVIRYRRWLPVAVQFLFGGLFSSYVIFYFHSAALSKDLLFVALLFLLLVANEILDQHVTNLKLELLLYFLSLFAFFTFFLPVVFKVMSVWLFIVSGILSLSVCGGILYFLLRKDTSFRITTGYVLPIVVTWLVMNGLYFFNWIPPVPLSVKQTMIGHHIQRADADYLADYEPSPWYVFWQDYDSEFHFGDPDTLFCFVSVFAPTRLEEKIYHHWQVYDRRREQWLTADRLGYRITGGREGGYRGFTYKTHVRPGEWRVNVETESGKILGRLHFRVVSANEQKIKLKRAVL